MILRQAIKIGNLTQIKNLIADGADVNQIYWDLGDTLLKIAIDARQNETVQLLLEAGADPNYEVFGTPPLFDAAAYGYSEIVKTLIKAGANVHDKDNSALVAAATKGHLEVVKLLIKSGSDTSSYEYNTHHPLFWSILQGHWEVYQYLAPLTLPQKRNELTSSLRGTRGIPPNRQRTRFLVQRVHLH